MFRSKSGSLAFSSQERSATKRTTPEAIPLMQANRTSTLVLWIVVVFVVGIVAGPTPAAATHGGDFYDDFSDLDFSDDSPVSWIPNGSVLDASSGDLVMTTGSTNPRRAFTSVPEWADVSVHTQIRLLEGEQGSENSHSVRVGVEGPGAINGGITPDGEITIRIFDPAVGGPGVDLASTMTGLDMFSSDIHLRFNVLGDMLSLSAWADGILEPAIPQLMVTFTPFADFTEADIAIQGQRVAEGSTSMVAFRFVDVMVIPEPSSALLMGLGLIGLAASKKTRRPERQ